MEKELIRKQKRRLFIGFLLTFSLLFTVLGFTVFQAINLSMYENVDTDLKNAVTDNNTFAREIQFLNHGITQKRMPPFDGNSSDKPIDPPKDFQQIALLRNDKGEILNQGSIGVRYSDVSNIPFSKKGLNTITDLKLTDESGNAHYFHSIMVPVNNEDLIGVAYLQVIVNTDQLKESMAHFKTILLWCMLLAYLLALVLSDYLNRRALKPIIIGWRQQQDFVANASHELRTPLSVMQSQLESIFLKPQQSVLEASEPIATTLSQIRRLTKLSNELLLLAKSDAEKLSSEKTWQEPAEFFAKIIEPYEELAKSEGKEFILKNTFSGKALFDGNQMQQVLLILLDNALKYTKPGNEIQVISQKSEKYWQVKVMDNGIGFQEKNPELLFERFYRADLARTTKGTGLGLSIAKTIIDSHHGKITAEKNHPKGAIFTWKIPIKG